MRYVGIKKREKFESLCRLLRDDSFTMLTPDEAEEIIGTIEGLERVSRAVLTLDLMKAGLEGGGTRSIRKADMKLGTAMVALPNWLTGANNE